jgi:hypothetical protein
MKSKIILSSTFVLFLALGGIAQEKPAKANEGSKSEAKKNMSPDEKAKQEADKAEKKLGLSADQKTKWQQAALTRIQNNKPFVDKLQGSTTPEERKDLKSKIKANAKTFDTTVNGFLSAEQKTKWEAMKKEKKNEMQHKMKGTKMQEEVIED